ncbi:MAG: enoyl-CoA hydratase/isomerase family protein, partial [Acidobacteria bacterium]|nr:enoyl-CoA hydratase/isomerase family protein [Candidatus Polarisedimenticola svalbardensis]
YPVILVDIDDGKVARGMEIIATTLKEGVERRIFRPEQAEQIQSRITGTSDWSDLADVDLAVEAVFEDESVKKKVFARLEEHCSPEAILATNTSSFLVTELAEGMEHPERFVGLHYFYHPAKNRLVEVIPGQATSDDVTQRAWSLQEQIGKTPIASADASGFVVNRYFVPWLNEAVRLMEEGVADIPTIEAAAIKTFRVGMGPFQLMNVTGVQIAMHAAETLGEKFGPFYAPTKALCDQVALGENWELEGSPDESKFAAIEERMLGAICYVAAQLVDEKVSTIEDTDIGARVGLRWPIGPFQLMNRIGVSKAAGLAGKIAAKWDLALPKTLSAQGDTPFTFQLVKSEVRDGVATLTLNRPDAMNALNEDLVGQLHDAFRKVAGDDSVRGIVIAGAGKGFIAGADIRFFVKNIKAKTLDRIVTFTQAGHDLLNDFAACPKPVIARMHGLALGGGLELALACHKIIASEKAMMAFPETGIGICPGLGGTQRSARRVGTGLASWLVLTGQMVPASKAAAIGLVDRVVPHGDLDEAVLAAIEEGPVHERTPGAVPDKFAATAALFDQATADDLLAGSVDTGDDESLAKAVKKVGTKAPVAVRLSVKMIREGAKGSLSDGLAMELAHLLEIFSTADAYEGLSTLGRKRPEFKGC